MRTATFFQGVSKPFIKYLRRNTGGIKKRSLKTAEAIFRFCGYLREPFNQKSELKELLKEVKKMGLGTLVFTGFTYEEICNTEAIKYCDYLIDGPFIKEIPPVCKYTGSGNQRFLKLKNGKIAEDLTLQYKGVNETEIIIQEDGSVLITGFSEI